jgi:hypothetical protein
MVRSGPPLLAVFPPPCSALARLRASVSPDGERSVALAHSVLEMISFMISLVPPKIRCTRADVQAREIGYSFM